MARAPKAPASATDAAGRRSYHHPDLRTALINATLDRVAEKGLEGLSFRELAKMVGVSHTAPRRHFADRDELIAAASLVVSDELMEEVDRSLHVKSLGLSELESFARAFLTLSERNPRLQRLLLDMDIIFRSDVSPAVLERSLATFDRIVEGVAAALSPPGDTPAAARRTIVLWSIVHGFSVLDRSPFIRQALERYASRADVIDDVVRAATRMETADGEANAGPKRPADPTPRRGKKPSVEKG